MKPGCKTVNFPHQVQQMHYTHIPLLEISQSVGHLQAKKKKKERRINNAVLTMQGNSPSVGFSIFLLVFFVFKPSLYQ